MDETKWHCEKSCDLKEPALIITTKNQFINTLFYTTSDSRILFTLLVIAYAIFQYFILCIQGQMVYSEVIKKKSFMLLSSRASKACLLKVLLSYWHSNFWQLHTLRNGTPWIWNVRNFFLFYWSIFRRKSTWMLMDGWNFFEGIRIYLLQSEFLRFGNVISILCCR